MDNSKHSFLLFAINVLISCSGNTPPVFNVPTTSSVGDVYVNVSVPQGVKVDKHLMNGFGNQILSGIRAELKINK